MYAVNDRVVKISNRAGEASSRFVEVGTRGTVVSVTPPAADNRDGFPYIKVRFNSVPELNIKGGDEWCYEEELVRADAWDMFTTYNDRDPTPADVVENLEGVQLLELAPVVKTRQGPVPVGEIVGDGPRLLENVYDLPYEQYVEVKNQEIPPPKAYAVAYDPPGGVPGQTPDRVMVPERNGGFTWVVYIDDSTLRKMQPVGTVVTEYFPDGLLGVAAVAWVGNEKHNPGEHLHWSRGKSFDHIDGELRHAIDAARPGADGWDTIALPDGRVFQVRHKAAKAWRALADAQIDAENNNYQVIRRLK